MKKKIESFSWGTVSVKVELVDALSKRSRVRTLYLAEERLARRAAMDTETERICSANAEIFLPNCMLAERRL